MKVTSFQKKTPEWGIFLGETHNLCTPNLNYQTNPGTKLYKNIGQ